MSLRKFYDLVIFDWAGTMVDFGCCAPVCALIEAFKRYDVAVTEEEVRRDMGKAKADHVRALLSEQRIAGAWHTANGRNPTAEDIERLISDLTPLMREQAARAASLIEGARATVDALRAAGL
jgi:phosphonoacetaldehyde hydrolase